MSYPTLIPCLVQSLFYNILSSSPMSYTAQILFPNQPWTHVLYSPDSISCSHGFTSDPMFSSALVPCLIQPGFNVWISYAYVFFSFSFMSFQAQIPCLNRPWSRVFVSSDPMFSSTLIPFPIHPMSSSSALIPCLVWSCWVVKKICKLSDPVLILKFYNFHLSRNHTQGEANRKESLECRY